jgi:hypothetical protein
MHKQLILIIFILLCFFSKSQTDSTTQIDAKPIAESLPKKKEVETKKTQPDPPILGVVFKPKISFGIGMLSFHGDLYSKHYQAPWTARIGYDLNISQRLYKFLQLNFNILFGKLGANEWIDNRQENFQSEIRSGGLSLMYDFGNFIPEQCRIRPWVSVGINSFEFLSKTDLFDRYGNKYFYWNDGSIKNIAESSPTASLAVNINRDYVYETDIRELNKDGFGKYQERAWAFPVGVGALMKVTDRFDFKIGFQYYLTTTDYIDGITNKSVANRSGTKQRDNFVYTSFALQYDLVLKKKSKSDTLPKDYFDNVDWLAIDKEDYDEDGVKDLVDKCHGTPSGVKVDDFGCPFDDDKDGVPNHADDELASPLGIEVNMKGVALTDEYWQNWYNVYMDSGNVVKTEILDNFYSVKKDSSSVNKPEPSKNELQYTIELVRYTGPVPDDEMAYLLSIGDIKSTVLPDNSTVLYTAGTYIDFQNAIKRRDEFIAEGIKSSRIGYFKNGDFIALSNDEINKLLDSKKAETNAAISTSTANGKENSISINADAQVNEFAKGDIVYRVQLGAYKNRISEQIFKNAGTVVELKTDDNYYRYATKGFKTIQSAANAKADLVLEGYGDAFITAYKDGKRIAMNTTKATMETNEKEDISKIASFSSIDKSLVSFKIQLGALRKSSSNDMEEKTKDLPGIEKQSTGSGMIRYTLGSFNDYPAADKYRQELAEKGFSEAFVIAIFKGEVISIQEALELLK